MTLAPRVITPNPGGSVPDPSYQPGICNIGPAEIARRRRAGHAGLAVTIVVLAALIALGAPPLARLLVVLPAAAAASGYLQALLHFCVGFASRGWFNFGALGSVQTVEDAEARRRDRARGTRISLASLGIGVVVGLVAVLLPL